MLVAPVRDGLAGIEARPVPHEGAQLVIAQEQHVLGIVQHVRLDELGADGDQDGAQAGVCALINVKVVIRREGVECERAFQKRREAVAFRAVRHPVHQLVLRGLQIRAHGGDGRGVVVVGVQVAPDRLQDGPGILAPERGDELVRPDRLVPEGVAPWIEGPGDEGAPLVGALQGREHVGRGPAREGVRQDRARLDDLFHAPQRLDGVPVAVRDARLEASGQVGGQVGAQLGDGGVQLHRGAELREVDHPVDLPVTVMDVHRVLEQDGEAHEALALHVVPVEPGEVAFDLRTQPVVPPAHEVAPVMGQDRIEIGRDEAGVVIGERDAGRVSRSKLLGIRP